MFLPGLLVGRLFDLGHFRIPFTCSSVLIVVATFLVPECKEYWQYLLCQGFAVGIGCGGIYSSNTALVAQWFKRRRGLAIGMTTVGASIGGLLFPIAIRNLLSSVGFAWTMRTLGFAMIFFFTIGNVTVRQRLPPKKASKGLLQFGIFKNMAYSVYCLSSFFAFLGLYTVLTFVASSAVFYGVSPGFAPYLIAIANGVSGFGRCASGVLSDHLGSMNVMIPLTAAAGAMTYAWPFARTEASMIVVAIIYGFTSGAYIALLVNPLMPMGEMADVGSRIGIFVTILGCGALIGPPISGAIYRATGGYTAVGYYAGSMVMVSVCLMLVTRYLVLRRFRGKF